MNGPSVSEGKVLMCLNEVWGSFCPSSLDNNDAKVVCYQLGYSPKGKHSNSNIPWINFSECGFFGLSHTGVVVNGDYHASASDLVLFQNVSCEGNESSLEQCSITVLNKQSTCGMYNLPAVKCICELNY